MTLTLVDRFHPKKRAVQQVAIDAGLLQKRDELELLTPEQIRPLARFSLILLAIGSVFFIVLNIIAYALQARPSVGISGAGFIIWLLINITSSIIILPVHELLHGLAFLVWGGRPHFGAKLPFALYCGARNQLFHRNHYLIVGLAPLVILTLIAIICIVFAPFPSSYVLLAFISNFSGSAGDIWAVRRLLRQPSSVLVADTETGYIVWELPVS